MIKQIDPEVPGRFGNLDFLARQVVEGFITGMHKSPFHGFSVEFAEHRIYNPGESTRHIDWKLFARTEKLFVKRYEEETNLRCQIVIDTSSSMHFRGAGRDTAGTSSKLDFSIECAAALIYLLRKQRDAVGLSLLSDKTELHTEAKSSSVHYKMLYTHLDKIYKKKQQALNVTTNTSGLLHLLAEKIHKRSLVVIFSDMMDNQASPDALFSALQHLKHNKHEVILFHVYEREQERDLSYKSRPFRFIDMETGKSLRLNPADIKDKYVQSMADYFHNLRLKCMQYKIDFVPGEINEGYEKVLMGFLVKRAKLY
ncbi:MAG: DUF58 domain-containing protein [Bacteroidales bacterium]|nr:DUF58 domain-containing protein [Bacteroidales bacterium]